MRLNFKVPVSFFKQNVSLTMQKHSKLADDVLRLQATDECISPMNG